MPGTTLADWWETAGRENTRRKVERYSHLDIGTIPITNLEIGLPEGTDQEELCRLMTNDGISCALKNSGRSPEVVLILP